MPICLFQLGFDGGQARLGWVDVERQRVLELSETIAGLLSTSGTERVSRIMAARRSAVGVYPINHIKLRAPVDLQEIWAAGVTYERSRDARMEESSRQDVYQQVYDAERPEIFFKAAAWRCVGDSDRIGIRHDSTWDVPEPELTLVIDSSGAIAGYTIGNDVSSRSIEGENPLYLPQAKSFHASCSLGPWIVLSEEMEKPESCAISMSIVREGQELWAGETSTARMRRTFRELVDALYSSLMFPDGALLMTGTGLVPPDEITVEAGDQVTISIAGIGTLTNTVARLSST